MDDREFQDAVKKLRENNARIIESIERMPSLTNEQKSTVAEILVRQKNEYGRYIKSRFEIKTEAALVKDAWNAAQRAAQEDDPDDASQPENWRAMWIALALVGVLLLLMKALSR